MFKHVREQFIDLIKLTLYKQLFVCDLPYKNNTIFKGVQVGVASWYLGCDYVMKRRENFNKSFTPICITIARFGQTRKSWCASHLAAEANSTRILLLHNHWYYKLRYSFLKHLGFPTILG